MYWVEITGGDGKNTLIQISSDSELNSLVPVLANAGLEVKFGLTGTSHVIGGCVGSIKLLDGESLQG